LKLRLDGHGSKREVLNGAAVILLPHALTRSSSRALCLGLLVQLTVKNSGALARPSPAPAAGRGARGTRPRNDSGKKIRSALNFSRREGASLSSHGETIAGLGRSLKDGAPRRRVAAGHRPVLD